MTLVKCVDCGNDVSTSAASCPKCGAPGPTVAAIQQQLREQHERSKPYRLGAAAAISLGMLGWVGLILDLVPVDSDAGLSFAILVGSLIVGGALFGLVTLYWTGRPHS